MNNSNNQITQKIKVPYMHYDIKNIRSDDALNDIKSIIFGNRLTDNENRPCEWNQFLQWLFQSLWFRHTNQISTYFSYISAPPSEEITKKVIGYDGYYFKMTTNKCGVDFIWHDLVNRRILFWGPTKFSVVKAMNSIRWRITTQYYLNSINLDAMVQQHKKDSEYKDSEYKVSEYKVSEYKDSEYKDHSDDDSDYDEMPALISMGSVPDYENTQID
jgi:hypothetical protein